MYTHERRQGSRGYCHKVFIEICYTSPILFLTLYDKKVQACGTARTHRRYYIKELAVSERGEERGWYDYRSSPPLLACAWKDKEISNFLSTMHWSVLRTVVSDGQVTREAVMCPPIVPDYQAFMRGVDSGDQLIKRWKRAFGYVIEL